MHYIGIAVIVFPWALVKTRRINYYLTLKGHVGNLI